MKQILHFASFVTRFELCITLLLLVVFLLPMWTLHAMPTLDGPSHIYNSRVIWQLWTNSDSWLHQFVMINQNPSPNWVSQPIMALLSTFFSPYVVEKIMLCILIASFVFAFRFFIFTILPSQKILAFLAFVFVYNGPLFLGYFNYNFGIVLFFCATALLYKFPNSPTWRSSFVLAITVVVLYFSHLIACALFALVAVFIVIQNLISCKSSSIYTRGSTWIKMSPGIFPLLFLFGIYFLQDRENGIISYMAPAEIANRIIRFSANCCLSSVEYGFSRWIYYVVAGGIVLSLVTVIPSIKKFHYIRNTDSSGVITITGMLIIIVLCTFLLPDGTSFGGGALTERLVFLSGAFLTMLVFSLFKHQLIQLIMVMVLVVVHVDKVGFIREHYAKHQQELIDIENASRLFDQPGFSVVLNFKSQFPLGHIAKQLGMKDGLLMLDSWSHKPFNCLQWSEEYIFDPELLCWVGDQWLCDPDLLERRLNSKVQWITTIGGDQLIKQNEVVVGRWDHYLSDSCHVHAELPGEIVIYKRNE